MKRMVLTLSLLVILTLPCHAADGPKAASGWIPLFDGKTLSGWKIGGNQDSFRVEDGVIVANGPVAHLFYMGDVENHDFTNFAIKADIMTFPKANSGFYFHTEFQKEGFPKKGHEVQVNNSHRDPKRTAGLYGVQDVYEAPAKDNEWFTLEIIVRAKHVTTKVNGKTLVDYTEPADVQGGRRVSHGTFALQAHDPVSKVLYKSIQVKPLP